MFLNFEIFVHFSELFCTDAKKMVLTDENIYKIKTINSSLRQEDFDKDSNSWT